MIIIAKLLKHTQRGVKMASYPVIAVDKVTKDLLVKKLNEINELRKEALMLPLNKMQLTHRAISEFTVKQGLK